MLAASELFIDYIDVQFSNKYLTSINFETFKLKLKARVKQEIALEQYNNGVEITDWPTVIDYIDQNIVIFEQNQ